MKIRIYFNEKSILNSPIARGINYIVLAIIGLGTICTYEHTCLISGVELVVCISIIVGGIIAALCTSSVLTHTEFYEWDYTERKKKHRFTITYMLLSVIFSCLFTFSLGNIYLSFNIICLHPILLGLSIFISFVFLVNAINIISLHYMLFKNDLTATYKIQKKPQNWQESGQELSDQSEIDEIMQRDFGV